MGRRMNMYPQPWRKHMEAYENFNGGINTMSSSNALLDNELTYLQNIDLTDRFSLRRRKGFKMYTQHASEYNGNGQGHFLYYRTNGNVDHITAVRGKLFKNGSLLPIQGMTGDFQRTRQVEAVQVGESLVIATGTKLVEYDGTNAKVVDPYVPDPLEYLYLGSNALSDDPYSGIKDGEALFLRIDGAIPSKRYGIANEPVIFKVVVSKPAGSSIEYRYEFRFKGATEWTEGRSWTSNNELIFRQGSAAEYELKFEARAVGSSDPPAEYRLPVYEVKEVDDEQEINRATIQTCNRVFYNWGRLYIYGDEQNKQALYISQVDNFRYFPTPNSLLFENERNEPLTDIVKHRDTLVAFTQTSIQALHGKHPNEFSRYTINSVVGCKPFTAKVIENYIIFFSLDGVYLLKSAGTIETRANVEKIDITIQNTLPVTEDAYAVVHDLQYHLHFPSLNTTYRYYFQLRSWTLDKSDRLRFNDYTISAKNELFMQDITTGNIYRVTEEEWTDDGHVYEDIIETKMYDFGEPYNPKKLKEVQIMMRHFGEWVNLYAYVYADTKLVLDPREARAFVNEDTNYVEWEVISDPNLKLDSGTIFGQWTMGESAMGGQDIQVHALRIAGKCRYTRLRLVHNEPTPNQFLGVAYIFKTKRP